MGSCRFFFYFFFVVVGCGHKSVAVYFICDWNQGHRTTQSLMKLSPRFVFLLFCRSKNILVVFRSIKLKKKKHETSKVVEGVRSLFCCRNRPSSKQKNENLEIEKKYSSYFYVYGTRLCVRVLFTLLRLLPFTSSCRYSVVKSIPIIESDIFLL